MLSAYQFGFVQRLLNSSASCLAKGSYPSVGLLRLLYLELLLNPYLLDEVSDVTDPPVAEKDWAPREPAVVVAYPP